MVVGFVCGIIGEPERRTIVRRCIHSAGQDNVMWDVVAAVIHTCTHKIIYIFVYVCVCVCVPLPFSLAMTAAAMFHARWRTFPPSYALP